MRAININVTPYQMISVLSCQISKKVNTHSYATISGIIDETLIDSYLEKAQVLRPVKIMAKMNTGETTCIFCGVLKKMSVKVMNHYYVVTIEIGSFSEEMDVVEHTRTFQRPDILYRDILDFFSYYDRYSFFMCNDYETAINQMIVQYCETDWEFIKRLASHFNSFIIPYSKSEGVKYYFGFQSKVGKTQIDTPMYSVERDIMPYDRFGHPFQQKENSVYVFKDREILDLSDMVILNKQELYIYEVHSELEKGELQNTYKLKKKEGFMQPYVSNYLLTGSALQGTVLKVQRDEVQVELYADQDNSIKNNVCWIPYSTVYSTNDGTGWYMMPEIGDEIRLYFPSEQDASGFVMSSVHLESSDYFTRATPDEKSLRNIHGKEVLLTPDKIIMSNNAGMAITIDDNKGIFIESDKDICINAQDAVNMVSANSSISITGSSRVEIQQNNSSIELKDEVFFKGTQVHIQ